MSLYRPKGSKIWVMDFWIHGERVRESTGMTSKTRAREVENMRKQRIRDGQAGIRRQPQLGHFGTVAKAFWDVRRSKLSGNSVADAIDQDERERYLSSDKARQSRFDCSMKHLLPHFGKKLLVDIDARDIARFQEARLATGAENSTVNRDIELLRQIMRRHGLWARIAPDVKMLPERRDTGHALSDAEERMLLIECERSDQRLLLPFIVLLIETGARFNTIRRLRWKDVDMVKGVISIGIDKTKAGTGRIVPLSSRALAIMKMLESRYPEHKPIHYVFPLEQCLWVTRENKKVKAIVVNPTRPFNSIKGAWKSAKKRTQRHCNMCTSGLLIDVAPSLGRYECTSCSTSINQIPVGLIKLRLHDLRHTAVSRMLAAKTPLPMIGKIVGWSPSTLALMIARYGHFSMDDMRAAVESISRVDAVDIGFTAQNSLVVAESDKNGPLPVVGTVRTIIATGRHAVRLAKYDRNELYEKVWQKPLNRLAREYGVSDVALAKTCRALLIPLPEKGHWAKRTANQRLGAPPPLPPGPGVQS